MATAPLRVGTVPQSATKAAVTPDGRNAVNTATVINQIAGDKELHITIVGDEADVLDFPLFQGLWDDTDTAKGGLLITADGFATYKQFKDYFRGIATNITGIRMETDDVDVYNGLVMKFIEKEPSGRDNDVTFRVSRYRQQVGNGYGESLEIGSEDLNYVQWPGLRVELSKMKASATLHIYFTVQGWNKSQELNPIQAAIL